MAYAVIDYKSSKKRWGKINTTYDVGEVNISLPHFKEKQTARISKKVLHLLEIEKIKNVVISRDLSLNKLFCELLTQHNKNIITGRKMFKALILRILKDVAAQMKMELAKLKVVLLIDFYSVENADLVRTIAKEVKTLTVVTTDKDKFDKLIKDLFEGYGITVKVVEKNITRFDESNVLINVDFSSYDMNRIVMPAYSLIICGFANHFEIPKNFQGIVIKDIDIIDVENENEMIDDLALCEAKIYSYLRRLKENDRVFERENFKINGYFGTNGKILLHEFRNLGKNLLDK